MEFVEMILYKKVNNGDLLNIDREVFAGATGGGQTYFDLGGINQEKLVQFLEYGSSEEKDDPESFENRKKYTIEAFQLGKLNHIGKLEFDPRKSRNNYKISDQRNNRHSAWLPSNGFPTIPLGARYAADIKNIPNLFIFIVKTTDKKYYAGFINNQLPISWESGLGLERLLSWDNRDTNKGFIDFESESVMFENNILSPFKIVQANNIEEKHGGAVDPKATYCSGNSTIDNYDPHNGGFEFITESNNQCEMPKDDETFEIDIDNLEFEEYMPPFGSKIPSLPSGKRRAPRKINYDKINKGNKIKGDLGEETVVIIEKEKLISLGRQDLADTVEWVSKSKGDGLGYDIESWNVNEGNEEKIYIEVKTTTGQIDNPFDISIKEVEVSKELGDKYYIYRIFGIEKVTKKINYYIINGDVTKYFDLIPYSFKAYLKVHDN